MVPTYRRFHQLSNNARRKLQSKHYGFEEQLRNAVGEISMMNENDIPEYKRGEVENIIKSCRTHKAVADEGEFMASINQMSHKQKLELKSAIEYL